MVRAPVVQEVPRVQAALAVGPVAPHGRTVLAAARVGPRVRVALAADPVVPRARVALAADLVVPRAQVALEDRRVRSVLLPPPAPRLQRANAAATGPRRRNPPARNPKSKNGVTGAGTGASTKTSAAAAVVTASAPLFPSSSDAAAELQDQDDDGEDDTVIRLRIVVPRECDGWRLDHFLKRRIGRLSRTRIQQIIATQIELGGRRARPSTPVHQGETVFLERPAPVEPDVPRTFDVLYEDDAVLVIDKPAGLPMHTSAKFWRNTLVAVLRERYPAQHTEICHRIDRETSGVMLIARTAAAGSLLKSAFAQRRISKRYLALVKGCPPDHGVIDQPIKLLETPTHLMMGPADDGLPAITRFEVVKRFTAHALVAASPETGRQHQIRVHLAALGFPLVGDKLYGAGEEYFMAACDTGISAELLARFDGLARHALHAERLTFPHPVSGKAVTVTSPLPDDLTAYMGALT